MALKDKNGNVLTKANLIAKATAVTQPTAYKFNEDVFETYGLRGAQEQEKLQKRKYHKGQIVTAAEIDALSAFANVATIDTVSPATGPIAGGTTVTITGSNFGGASSVTFGGTAGTSFKVVSPSKITVKTPAKTAGAVNVVVVDDGGNATKNNGFTYA